ncbi:MAG: CotH kinase family protein [Flavobacteriales bacterium]|nr:CotH kinase family protein [Flavobacteriales bacterium]
MRAIPTLPLLVLSISAAFGQGAGDALFDTDQVIEMRFTFPNDNYWVDLSMNHNEGLEESLWAGLEIVDNTGTHFLDSVGVRLKGNSSYDFYPSSKKPMKIDFNEFVGGQDYHGLKKLNLNNCWSDPTFMREKIFFDVSREAGVLAPRMSYANVYLNDIFWGFYALVEQVDKTFLEHRLGENDGNLFKAGDNYTPDGGGLGLEADLNHYGASAGDYTGRYELKTNETANDWTDLIELLDLVDNASITELAQQLPQRMVLDEALRSLALDNLFGNMDAYYGSSRNFYLYHDSSTFKWNWIKWDANMCFGRYVPQWIEDPATLHATYASSGRRLLQRVMQHQGLRVAYLNEFCGVLEQFSNEQLDPRMDALRALIEDHVEGDINKEFADGIFALNIEGTVSAQSGQTWNTIPGLKSFVADRRANVLASSLNCTTAGVEEVEGVPLAAFPNPTSGLVQLTLPTGVKDTDVMVMDVMGRSVPVIVQFGRVDLSGTPAGSYFVIARTPDTEARVLVVKE